MSVTTRAITLRSAVFPRFGANYGASLGVTTLLTYLLVGLSGGYLAGARHAWRPLVWRFVQK